MAVYRQLVVKYGADIGEALSGAERLNASIDASNREMSNRFGALTGKLKGVGVGLTAAVTAPIVAGAAKSVTAFASMDEAMRNVNSLAHMSEKDLNQLGQAMSDLSVRFGKDATDLARAGYDIVSSGFEGAEIMKILETSALGAGAGLASTAEAADALTTVLNAYGMSASEVGRINDIMFKAVDKGKIEYDELAKVLGGVVATASAAGVEFEELAAGFSVMTIAGNDAADTSTALNRIILAFLNPSEKMARSIAEAGYASGAAVLQTKGLAGAMQFLLDTTGGSAEELAQLGMDARALKAALSLARADGAKFTEALEQMKNSSGAADEAFKEQQKSLQFQMNQTKQQAERLFRTLGSDLAPIVAMAVKGIGKMASAFEKLPKPMRQVIELETVHAAALGPAILLFTQVVSVISDLKMIKMANSIATIKDTAVEVLNTAAVKLNTTATLENSASRTALTGTTTALTASTTALTASTSALAVSAGTAATSTRWLWTALAAAVGVVSAPVLAIAAVAAAIEGFIFGVKINKYKKQSKGVLDELRKDLPKEQVRFAGYEQNRDSAQLEKDLASQKYARELARKGMREYEDKSEIWSWRWRWTHKEDYELEKLNYDRSNQRVIWLKKLIDQKKDEEDKQDKLLKQLLEQATIAAAEDPVYEWRMSIAKAEQRGDKYAAEWGRLNERYAQKLADNVRRAVEDKNHTFDKAAADALALEEYRADKAMYFNRKQADIRESGQQEALAAVEAQIARARYDGDQYTAAALEVQKTYISAINEANQVDQTTGQYINNEATRKSLASAAISNYWIGLRDAAKSAADEARRRAEEAVDAWAEVASATIEGHRLIALSQRDTKSAALWGIVGDYYQDQAAAKRADIAGKPQLAAILRSNADLKAQVAAEDVERDAARKRREEMMSEDVAQMKTDALKYTDAADYYRRRLEKAYDPIKRWDLVKAVGYYEEAASKKQADIDYKETHARLLDQQREGINVTKQMALAEAERDSKYNKAAVNKSKLLDDEARKQAETAASNILETRREDAARKKAFEDQERRLRSLTGTQITLEEYSSRALQAGLRARFGGESDYDLVKPEKRDENDEPFTADEIAKGLERLITVTQRGQEQIARIMSQMFASPTKLR